MVMEQQLSIFDWLPNLATEVIKNTPLKKIVEEPVYQLKIGQRVYCLQQADVTEYDIESAYMVGEKAYYSAKSPIHGCHTVFPENRLTVDVFEDREEAANAVRLFFENHKDKIITAEMLEKSVKEIEVYTYPWKDDVLRNIFLCKIDDMTYYVKNPFTYKHIVRFKTEKEKNKFLDKFHEETKTYKAMESEEKPQFVNLYKCSGDTNWDYSEAGYGGIMEGLRR